MKSSTKSNFYLTFFRTVVKHTGKNNEALLEHTPSDGYKEVEIEYNPSKNKVLTSFDKKQPSSKNHPPTRFSQYKGSNKSDRRKSGLAASKHDEVVRVQAVKTQTPIKSQNTTTDDEEDKHLEVDERIAFSTLMQTQPAESLPVGNLKWSDAKQDKKTRNPAEKGMVKKVPNFFGLETKEEMHADEIESAYTELAKKLLLQQLGGKTNSSDIYTLMTNDYKLRSIIEKKYVNKKVQK